MTVLSILPAEGTQNSTTDNSHAVAHKTAVSHGLDFNLKNGIDVLLNINYTLKSNDNLC